MNGKRTSFACFGLGAVFAVSLVLIGAQNGPLNRVLAAPAVVMPASGLHAFQSLGCGTSDLGGAFGFYRIGATDVPTWVTDPTTKKLVPPPVLTAPYSNPLASVGIIDFDGKGSGFSYQRQNREGVLKPLTPVLNPDSTTAINSTVTSFSYSVSPDCSFLLYSDAGTGTALVRTYSAQGVILGNGDEFYMMSMAPLAPASAVVVVAKRLPRQVSLPGPAPAPGPSPF